MVEDEGRPAILRSQALLLMRPSMDIFCERAWTLAMSMLTDLMIMPTTAPSMVGSLGAGGQLLGRLAAGIDAGPANQVSLDNGDRHACIGQLSRHLWPGRCR